MNNKIFISPSLLILILLCFFLPFVTISCQSQEIVSLNGFQLATGTTVDNPYSGYQEEIPGNENISLALFGTIIGIIIGFVMRNQMGAFISSGISFMSFFLLQTFKSEFTKQIFEKGDKLLIAKFEVGFIITCILFVSTAIFNIYTIFTYKETLSDQTNNSAQESFCSICGKKLEQQAVFCSECGTKIQPEEVI